MINRGGLKVFPDEVEERSAPSTASKTSRSPVSPTTGSAKSRGRSSSAASTLDELQAWCRATLAPYKIPVGLTLVDALPRNEMGKVLRQDLVPLATRT